MSVIQFPKQGLDKMLERLTDDWRHLEVVAVVGITKDGEILNALGARGDSYEPYLMLGATEDLRRQLLKEIEE